VSEIDEAVLPAGTPWRCPYCGESYQFQTHPACLQKALRERDEARGWARRYRVVVMEEHWESLGTEEPEWLKV
jgi:hypothetical protein